jgi:serine acetyltransferase
MIGAKFKNGLPGEDVPTIGDGLFIGTGALIVGK